MNIRKYEKKDRKAVIRICLEKKSTDYEISPFDDFIKTMFCEYYIDVEPENCFVAVDDDDIPFGYIYGVADYFKYKERFTPYLERLKVIDGGQYLSWSLVEMYDHEIFADEYPAHLHIDLLEGHTGGGVGSQLMEKFCAYLKERDIKGVMLIVGNDNTGAKRFYERHGFTKLREKESGTSYGKYL